MQFCETFIIKMKYQKLKKALILLEDGTIFHGKAVGKEGTAFGEVCFNTGMTGYQEIFTDPSYYGQLMVTTNAHIGNYGVNEDEVESDSIKISGLICRNFSYDFSRVNADGSLEDFNSNTISIGKDLAISLNLKVGDQITLMSSVGIQTIIGSLPKQESFIISSKTLLCDTVEYLF